MGGLPSLRRLPNAKIVISRHILPIQSRDFSNVAENAAKYATIVFRDILLIRYITVLRRCITE